MCVVIKGTKISDLREYVHKTYKDMIAVVQYILHMTKLQHSTAFW